MKVHMACFCTWCWISDLFCSHRVALRPSCIGYVPIHSINFLCMGIVLSSCPFHCLYAVVRPIVHLPSVILSQTSPVFSMFNIFSYVWYFFGNFLVERSCFQGRSLLKIVKQCFHVSVLFLSQ